MWIKKTDKFNEMDVSGDCSVSVVTAVKMDLILPKFKSYYLDSKNNQLEMFYK